MAAPSSIPPLVPGFDFLQDLVKGAGAAVPGLGQWVAPTLDPDELGKRIEELRTVQFWLEQNARVLATTVQALEVQRMTLSTLKSMNVSMTDMAEALKVQPPSTTGTGFGAGFGAGAQDPAPTGASSSGRAASAAGDGGDGRAAAGSARSSSSRSSTRASSRSGKAASSGSAASAGPGAVDPMQWWGALTRQFTDLAAQALRDGASAAAASGPVAAPAAPAAAGAAGDGKKAGKKASERAGERAGEGARSSTRSARRSSGARGSAASR